MFGRINQIGKVVIIWQIMVESISWNCHSWSVFSISFVCINWVMEHEGFKN